MFNMDAAQIVLYPLSTEKSIRMMEAENKLLFCVAKKTTRAQIAKAVEELFKAKVTKVNTFITVKGDKRAYVTFSKDTPAIDVATNLGLM